MNQAGQLFLVTPPPQEPITRAEAKLYAHIDHDDEDALVESLIKVAREKADGRDGCLGRALVQQTWDLKFRRFDQRCFELPLPPLQAVESVKYLDGSNVLQTLSSAVYFVSGVGVWGPATIEPISSSSWPSTYDAPEAISIRFRCGYLPDNPETPVDYAANVPDMLKLALKIMVAAWYGNRETTGEIPAAAHALLTSFRVKWVY